MSINIVGVSEKKILYVYVRSTSALLFLFIFCWYSREKIRSQIAFKQKDLKKKLKVTFAGEPGLDMGGLTKEWFLLLIREIFHAEYGMFVYYSHSRCYWFSTGQTDHTNLREYNLIGKQSDFSRFLTKLAPGRPPIRIEIVHDKSVRSDIKDRG